MMTQVPLVEYLVLGDKPHLVANECTGCGARFFDRRNACAGCFGTEFRKQAIALGLADELDLVMDQGGAEAFLPTRTLDRDTMLALKKSMVRRFYLRPSYLWRRLKSVRTASELSGQVREGLALLRRNV